MVIPYPRISPEIFRVGPIAVRWYGVMYLIGYIMGVAIAKRRVRRGLTPFDESAIDSLVGYLVIGMLLGARTFYVLVYDRAHYLAKPLDALAVWHGGLSFHGAALGMAIAIVVFARRHHVPFWSVADTVALAAPPGLFFGRIGNFINGELYGRASHVPRAMVPIRSYRRNVSSGLRIGPLSRRVYATTGCTARIRCRALQHGPGAVAADNRNWRWNDCCYVPKIQTAGRTKPLTAYIDPNATPCTTERWSGGRSRKIAGAACNGRFPRRRSARAPGGVVCRRRLSRASRSGERRLRSHRGARDSSLPACSRRSYLRDLSFPFAHGCGQIGRAATAARCRTNRELPRIRSSRPRRSRSTRSHSPSSATDRLTPVVARFTRATSNQKHIADPCGATAPKSDALMTSRVNNASVFHASTTRANARVIGRNCCSSHSIRKRTSRASFPFGELRHHG